MTGRSIKTKQTYSVLEWITVVAIMAWAILFLKYILTGEIALLIHPRFNGLVWATSFAFFGIGGFKTRLLLKKRQEPPLQHIPLLPPSWTSWLLTLTALAGLLTSPQVLGSRSAIQQGIADNLISTRIQAQPFVGRQRPEERTVAEWVKTFAAYPEPDLYAGQMAKVQGFVVHPPDLPDQYFVLTRFIIAHCALDAFPVGMLVNLSESRQAYPPDTWLDVSGPLSTEVIEGQRQAVIQPRSLRSISQPQNPYEYW